MNPYRAITVHGDPRTWHTPIVAEAMHHATGAGIDEADMGAIVHGLGSERQLDIVTAVHPDGPREERKISLVHRARHRYHDDVRRTRDLTARTGAAIERWAFNADRSRRLEGRPCNAVENRWAMHAPLVARRYREWRGLDEAGLILCADEDETFSAQHNGDRIQSFTCTIGEARIHSTWRRTAVELPILIPHTLDEALVGQPLSKAVQHPALSDPALVIRAINRREERTVLDLERAWTTLGEAS